MIKKGILWLLGLTLCLSFNSIKVCLATEELKSQQESIQPKDESLPSKPVKESDQTKEFLLQKLPEESTLQIVSKEGLSQFGLNIFKASPSLFEPVVEAPVGPDYIIGPGDNLIIELWGKFEAVHNLIVDKDGKLFIPKLGVVNVWGLSFSQTEKLIKEKFSKFFTDFQISVTMGKLRTIQVFVVGDVLRPGSYFVSSLATVFNALYAAGGSTNKGSLRRIRLIRNGRLVDKIDFYNFLLKGDKTQDYRLASGDTIFIPLRGPLVGIAGGIKRPAYYELRDETKLTDFIEMAGGVTPEGYLQRLQVERIDEDQRRIVADVTLSSIYANKSQDICLKDGDFVSIFPILKEVYQYVDLAGAVLRPGRYELKEGMTVHELLREATPLDEAYLKRADILRTFKDKHQEIIQINLEGTQTQSITLQQWDRVRVYSKWEIEPKAIVSITGLVKAPGTYTLLDKMKLSDLILRAGGFTKETNLLKAEVIRVLKDETIEVLPINIELLLKGEERQDITLEPYDRLNVYSVWQPQSTPLVRVMGLVRKPGIYDLTSGMRVSDLINRAGGLEEEATLLNAELSRITKSRYGVSFENIPLTLDQETNNDLPLHEDDMLFIRQIPKWQLQGTVTLSGEVIFPGVYAIKREEKLSSVLKRAGGFTKEAFLKGSVFIRRSVAEKESEEIKKRFLLLQEEVIVKEESKLLETELKPEEAEKRKSAMAKKRELLEISAAKIPRGRIVINLTDLDEFEGSKNDFVLEDGDSLFIPKSPISVTIIGEVYNPGALLYHKGEGLGYYLTTAGGITRTADKSEIYIVKSDGKVVKRGLLGFKAKKVEAGDVIVIPPIITPRLNLKDIMEPLYQFAATVAVIINIIKQ